VATPTPYDEFPYPGFPNAASHPDRLATLATLFGMSPAPVERCRVLELGCGDGGNLIPMAYGLRESHFLGLDLAPSAIARGEKLVRALALDNVLLVCADLSKAGPALGEFDFIVAHGVYSWVEDCARDALLDLCRTSLAPHGVAFVSYNALPGGHLRTMLREMMLFDGRGVGEPKAQVERARALLHILAEAHAGSAGYRQFVGEQLERVLTHSDASIFHDDLAPVNRPTYFHEFTAHAAGHGLQYLAEADFFEMHAGVSSPDVLAALDQLGDDVQAREQYLDFLKCRMYRQTLLCHGEVELDRRLEPDVITRFLVASPARPASPEAALHDRSIVEFHAPRGSALRTDEPLVKLALERLSGCWPRSVAFDELLRHSRSEMVRGGQPPRDRSDDVRVLGEILLRAYAANVVQLHLHQPDFATAPGERPRASALARLQAGIGDTVTNLRHASIRIEDAAGRRLLTLLDGTRDRRALLAGVGRDAAPAPHISLRQARRDDLPAQLESKLDELTRLALLEG
jgi:SAM-dependent methyltransferase